MSTRPRLVCLTPVRNGAEDLPGYLASAARFADAVVALDDGSTDGTRDLLEAAPLVEVVIANPPREDYRGWDDRANRNRLIDAAAALDPAWLLCLDADERVAPGDGEALREFVDTQALPGFAFAFTIFRMWGDTEHYDPAGYWVYRLFSFEQGQRFPDQRLHFDPIPTSIPRSRRLRTTLRIQHLAGMTAVRRAARLEKYRQADPDRVSGYRYPDLTEQPAEIRRWEPRPADEPVLLRVRRDDDGPALSAVIISRDDEQRIARTVGSVVGQEASWPFEVIVVTSGTDRTAEIVRRDFPQVTLVELPQRALPGEARNAGLRIARGDYVSFPGSHVELPPGSLAARIRAHDEGHAMVTGTTLNGTATRAGWASYFLDHSSVLPGRPSMELVGPPAHCSYLREALVEVGGFPEAMRAGEDTVVNNELVRRGYGAYRAQDVTLVHHSPCRTVSRLLRHHFVRGRGYGRILLDRRRLDGRVLHTHGLRALFRLEVLRRVAYTRRRVERWGGPALRREHHRARHLIRAAALSYWLGTCYELFRPGRAKGFVLWGRPVVTYLADENGATRLTSVDVLTRRAKAVRLPPGFDVEELAVRIDGHLTQPASPDSLTEVLRAVRGSGLGLREAVTLGWAAVTIRSEDVHEVNAAEDVTSELPRYLDTRNRRERVGPVLSREASLPGL